jgi:arylsulfatase A-like enzyme
MRSPSSLWISSRRRLRWRGGQLPSDRTLDGVNLIPFLTGENSGAPHERLFWRSGGSKGNHAVREGDWKLVRLGAQAPQLFNLANDIGEAHDLAAENPDKVTALTTVISEWEKGMIEPIFESPKAGKPKAKQP